MSPTVSRITLFVSVSVVLHALTLGAKLSYSGSVNIRTAPLSVTLQAALPPAHARLDVAPSTNGTEHASRTAVIDHRLELPSTPSSDAHPDTQIRARGAPDGMTIAALEEWFNAEELEARAEPLTPPKLAYPPELAGSHTAGRVRLALFIDEMGLVRKVHVVASTPERLFDSAAVRAWEDIRFSPATKGGDAVKSKKILDVDFTPD